MDKGKVRGRGGDWKPNSRTGGVNRKRKWVHDHKVFEGSVKEGQGFAFKRKQKIQYEYNKLLTKERRRNTASTSRYREEFPEHLKHLYVAEAQKLKKADLVNRSNRSVFRMAGQVEKKAEDTEVNDEEDDDEDEDDDDDEDDNGDDEDGDDATNQNTVPEPEAAAATVTEELETVVTVNLEPKNVIEAESIPMSNRLKKKMMRKTSYQMAQEQFEKARDERLKKNEEFLRKKKEKDNGIQRYKQKKKETFQILSKKTKKGQPNLNLQMEYLLQKIQGARK